MELEQKTALLGGRSPAQFMKSWWQKRPLLVRGALPEVAGAGVLPGRAELLALCGRDDVESRLIVRDPDDRWHVRHGPFARRALPPLKQPQWTLLVQGVDLHHHGAHELLGRFRFVPDARLDDIMLSYATDGGGVGPHFDHYDVFLVQVHGQRLWRIGRQRDLSLRDDLPLKVLSRFEPSDEYLLEPGDMLYLPPRYAHDGIALGECITCSVGFRTPTRAELAGALLHSLGDAVNDMPHADVAYADPGQSATHTPGLIPAALQAWALDALRRALGQPDAALRGLGEYLTEPKATVWFQPQPTRRAGRRRAGVQLDQRTRMMYDARHIYMNGEAWRAAGADARLMRRLADRRGLDAQALAGASGAALGLIDEWLQQGWLHER